MLPIRPTYARASGRWMTAACWMAFLALADGGWAEQAGTSQTLQLKPVESLWLAPNNVPTGDARADAAALRTLEPWLAAKTFDGFVLQTLPPTFVDPKDSLPALNTLCAGLGGKAILATLPVGREGWETSCNERMAQRMTRRNVRYDAGRATSERKWLEAIAAGVPADTWAWILEQPARMPTADEAARSAKEFIRIARERNKTAILWLSGQGLQREAPLAMLRGVCEATRDSADYFVWMDLPGASLETPLGELLDTVLTLSPKAKTVIQWTPNPTLPTKDPEGTRAYIAACQAKGLNRFCALVPVDLLDRDPWRDFLSTLPKAAPRG